MARKFKKKSYGDNKSLSSYPKNIWIDGYEANVPQRLGSGQVAWELLKNIEKEDKINFYTILLPSQPLADMPMERDRFRYKVIKLNKLWTRVALPLALFKTKERIDVFFSPTHYIPILTKIKRVVTIFDLAYLHFPEMFKKRDLWQLKNWTKYSIMNASHIITISNYSKEDIHKEYKINKNKITTAYPGYDNEHYYPVSDKAKISKCLEKYKVEGPYIIYIGTIQPRKNLIKLIDSFEKIENLKLVIVGKTTGQGRQGWMFEKTLNRPKELGIEEKIIFTGFVPTEELNLLVNGAVAFVLPSLYEGFGIPVVDAMACGIPVIVSNVSSLPEVVGDAGLKVNPNSTDQIEQAIRLISTDKKVHQKLSKMSKEQAKKFSWKKMAKQVIKVLEQV